MQACEALAAAHACGIVHRDIKPENLFLIQHGQGMDSIKVLDFGISKVALPRGKRDLVRTQMALGSPVYMSPEQIRRSDQVDARSDIWAVGCVLFELLTGVTAFDEPSLLELSAAILEREPVPLQTLRPDASDELEQVVLRCLSKNPGDRYQNVAELAIALYPFAPRRARISVERSFHILKKAGIVSTDLELSSAYPPALDVRSTSPSAAMTPRLSARTTTPAAVDLRLDEVPAELRPRRGRVSVLIGLSLMAAAGALVFLGLREPPPKSAAAPRGAEVSQSKSAAAPVASPTTGGVVDLDNEPAPPSASASGAPRTTPKAGRAPKAFRPAATATVKRAHGDDELDPGF